MLGNLTKYSATYDLYEYLDFENGLAVGQGQDGMVVWYQGLRYLIEPGGTFFIRAMYDGWNLALATHKQAEKQLVTWYLTTSELRAFPVSGTDEPIAQMHKPCWVAWFEFNAAPDQVPPGNAMIAIRWPLQSETILRLDGTLFARWAAGATVEEIEQKAASSDVPVLAYWDGRHWPRYPVLGPTDWLGVFGYCYADETMAVFEANLRHLIQAVPAHYPQIAIVCQSFTSNTALTTNLKGVVGVYARVARDEPRVTFLAPFSDQGRATGLQDHPELLPYWQELFTGVTGTPDNLGGNGAPTMDWQTIHTYGQQRWAELDVQGHSQTLVDAGLECREYQQDCFVTIASELYHTLGIGCELFWKAGVPEYGNPQDVKDKLQHIGEDILVERAANIYKDVVVQMGIPSAHWNASGGGSAVTPGDLHRCGPPPNVTIIEPPDPPDPPTPGHIDVLIHTYEPTASRSDPHGWSINYEVESDRPNVWMAFEFVGSGEPAIEVMFKAEPRIDGRYVRGLFLKPTVEGSWYPRVRARDDQGNEASADGATPVQVGP